VTHAHTQTNLGLECNRPFFGVPFVAITSAFTAVGAVLWGADGAAAMVLLGASVSIFVDFLVEMRFLWKAEGNLRGH